MLKIFITLKGHKHEVFSMAFSSNGSLLGSPSQDNTVQIWDIHNQKLLWILKVHYPICVAWSHDNRVLATGDYYGNISLWDPNTGELLQILKGHFDSIKSVAWSPTRNILASGSADHTIRLWENGKTLQVLRHSGAVNTVAWSPDGRTLCSSSSDHTVRLWDAKTGKKIRALEAPDEIYGVAWSPDGRHIAAGLHDKTVRIWNPETGQQSNILEAHTEKVVSVSFLDNGRLLGSLSRYGKLVIWRTDIWTEVFRKDLKGQNYNWSNFASHPMSHFVAVASEKLNEIDILEMDFKALLGAAPPLPTQDYINAKLVLVGDRGVGKSGLGIRMAEGKFRPTESTHGAQFWQIIAPEGIVIDNKVPNIRAELTVWDLAGQPEYRLVHQLFLDDTDVALLLFDCSDPDDPFRGVPYWAKVLKKHAPLHVIKLLVSARCDVSPVTVDQHQINNILSEYMMDRHFRTSAATGEGIEDLYQYILESIPWNKLPRTNTPRLFQVIREFLLEQKASGETLISMEKIQKEVAQRYTERSALQAEIDTVISLLQARSARGDYSDFDAFRIN